MRIINFQEKEKLQFILSLLMLDNENPFSMKLRDENNISCPNDILGIMLDRYVTDRTAVLPFKNGNSIFYLVLSNDSQKLIKHSDEIASFLVPVNAERFVGSPVKFDKLKGNIGKLGNKLFPLGYVFFKSPEPLMQEVFGNLKLWAMLDDCRPEVTPEEGEINAYILRSKFQQAIVLQKWDDAKKNLTLLREGHYISDENFHFLKIQFLSAQAKWDEIWESEDFTIISGLHPLPKAVRKAMLTAFHRVVLSYHEDKKSIEETLQAFEKNSTRLGTLISYRIGLGEDIFLRIFAYYAAIEKNREKLIGIKEEAENADTLVIINRLLELVPEDIGTQPDIEVDLTPLARALRYYKEMMYDEAYIEVVDCENTVDKVNILLGVATVTENEIICRQALNAFNSLDIDIQSELKRVPSFKAMIVYAMSMIREKEIVVDVMEEITSWEEWFKALLVYEVDKDYLADCMNHIIIQNQNDIVIKKSIIQKLEELILEIVALDEIKLDQKQLLRSMIPDFTTFILSDAAFPNQYATNLYEYLIEALQLYCNINSNIAEFILRLSEGLNIIDIGNCEKLWPCIERWFDFQPNIKTSFYVLEALTMFNDYGLASIKLVGTWNNWIGSILDKFSSETFVEMRAWFELGSRINADYTLLQMIKEKIESVNINFDPISLLEETKITIFSLREKSARRAAESIMNKNPKLKVLVCTDDRLTEHAKRCASNSDISIIVTACLSHALFYGIIPYIKNLPIYPRSAGETGIVEALEVYSNTLY